MCYPEVRKIWYYLVVRKNPAARFFPGGLTLIKNVTLLYQRTGCNFCLILMSSVSEINVYLFSSRVKII